MTVYEGGRMAYRIDNFGDSYATCADDIEAAFAAPTGHIAVVDISPKSLPFLIGFIKGLGFADRLRCIALDVTQEECQRRLLGRGCKTDPEKIAKRLAENVTWNNDLAKAAISANFPLIRIDANGSTDEVSQAILADIKRWQASFMEMAIAV